MLDFIPKRSSNCKENVTLYLFHSQIESGVFLQSGKSESESPSVGGKVFPATVIDGKP